MLSIGSPVIPSSGSLCTRCACQARPAASAVGTPVPRKWACTGVHAPHLEHGLVGAPSGIQCERLVRRREQGNGLLRECAHRISRTASSVCPAAYSASVRFAAANRETGYHWSTHCILRMASSVRPAAYSASAIASSAQGVGLFLGGRAPHLAHGLIGAPGGVQRERAVRRCERERRRQLHRARVLRDRLLIAPRRHEHVPYVVPGAGRTPRMASEHRPMRLESRLECAEVTKLPHTKPS